MALRAEKVVKCYLSCHCAVHNNNVFKTGQSISFDMEIQYWIDRASPKRRIEFRFGVGLCDAVDEITCLLPVRADSEVPI